MTRPYAAPYAEVIKDNDVPSKSPIIHRFWLEALGLDGDYRATRVAPDALADFFARRRHDSDWRGCNITIPHKIAALDHIEDRGSVRASIGAINTAFRAEDGAVVGTNTDAAGFYAPIADLDLAGAPVTIVGSGGAARAVLFALSRMVGRGDRPRPPGPQIGEVTVMSRSPLKSAGLLSHFGLPGKALTLDAKLPPAKLLVNASALGMTGQPPLDLDLSPLPDDVVVYDIVYTPLETPLLAAARARGLSTIDGLDMLIGQAAVAFELFFGAAPPRARDDELRALLEA